MWCGWTSVVVTWFGHTIATIVMETAPVVKDVVREVVESAKCETVVCSLVRSLHCVRELPIWVWNEAIRRRVPE